MRLILRSFFVFDISDVVSRRRLVAFMSNNRKEFVRRTFIAGCYRERIEVQSRRNLEDTKKKPITNTLCIVRQGPNGSKVPFSKNYSGGILYKVSSFCQTTALRRQARSTVSTLDRNRRDFQAFTSFPISLSKSVYIK